MSTITTASGLTRWFDQIGIDDVATVGGKNASLGEMYRELTGAGVRIPNGFATTADAYRHFLEETGLDEKIQQILADLDTSNVDNLRQRGLQVRQAILESELPRDLRDSIVEAYENLCRERGTVADVAVRSSATAEDLPDASFAGQQETYLNVRGPSQLIDACRRCYASLFTDRAISYRQDKGFDHFKIALSIGVQQMVRSDIGTSGVMFSLDTESGFRDAVLINAAFGLGENVVQGSVNPDEYYVFKPTLNQGCRPILKKTIGSKEFKLIYDLDGGKMTKNVPVPPEDRARFALNDDDILTLSRWACLIEDHYTDKRGHDCPMDMEWAKDGNTGELFIVQARPETVQSQKVRDSLETYRLNGEGRQLITGRAVGERIGSGPVRIINDASRLGEFRDGEVLVTDKTDPDWEPIMKKASAIVTNRGGRTCHAAIVSRELGLPAIVGTIQGTDVLQDGQNVTVCCAEGDRGVVYEGLIPFDVESTSLTGLIRPRTKVMMNVGSPEEVFALSAIPNDGVGLARMEFIISNHIKVHPLALLQYDKLTDGKARAEIDRLTAGYDDRPQFFVDTLAQGVGMIAAAFYPKDVIVRMSDFKSNEYANLIGGRQFEPTEENPMIGFRGASRYYDERYRDAFGLECRAMKKVREEMGLTNVKLMIPFCRTVEEGRRVQEVMAEHGLVRGKNGLELYVMCEIPSNVIAAEAFAEIFDGFSIGSNDLTQLTLGVDRDSEIVAHIFNERDAAVMDAVASAIATAKKAGRKIGICGQAPSDYPEFAQFLVEQGIDSISLNPDAVMKTTVTILEMEQNLRESNAPASGQQIRTPRNAGPAARTAGTQIADLHKLPATMKAFVMQGIGNVGFMEKPVPEPGPNDAVIKTTRALVCTSDVHTVKGAVGDRQNLTLGHEAVGVIAALGSEVHGFKVGDRVAVNAITPCFQCENCQRGYPSQCGEMLGGWKYANIKDGSFAEYFHVNDARANLTPIPDSISDDMAVYTTDMMSTGFMGAEHANIPLGGIVAIFAQGPVGLMATVGAKLLGAGLIIAVDGVSARRDMAKHFGADVVIDHTSVDPVAEIRRLTNGQGVDSAIECLGAQATFEACVKATRPGGTISVAGYFGHGDSVNIPRIEWGVGMSDKVIRTGLCPGGNVRMKRLLQLLESGRVDPTPLTTHRFPFEEVDKALHLMETKDDGILKPLIVFSS